uniref:Uncharacterized protein n=1 Tax=viral metagenome TaxID=1070528 RepID=A0A6C0KS07_9ZZZZ
MKNKYFKILIFIVFGLWVVYFFQNIAFKKEPFTPKLNSIYHPFKRRMKSQFHKFIDPIVSFPKLLWNNLVKWNII